MSFRRQQYIYAPYQRFSASSRPPDQHTFVGNIYFRQCHGHLNTLQLEIRNIFGNNVGKIILKCFRQLYTRSERGYRVESRS